MSPWSVRSRRRRRLARASVLAAMALALVGLISSAQATPANQDAEAVGNALESFADRLASASDALGEYQDLADSLPLTDLAPGDPEALDLSNLLDDIFTPANLGTFDDMPDLAGEVDALDGTYGGVTVQFGVRRLQPAAPSARPRARSRSRSMRRGPSTSRSSSRSVPSTWPAAASAIDFVARHDADVQRRHDRLLRRRRGTRDGGVARAADDRPLRERHRLGRHLHRALRLHRRQGLDRQPGHARHGDGDASRLRGHRLPGSRLDRRDHARRVDVARADRARDGRHRRRRGGPGERPRRQASTSTRR